MRALILVFSVLTTLATAQTVGDAVTLDTPRESYEVTQMRLLQARVERLEARVEHLEKAHSHKRKHK